MKSLFPIMEQSLKDDRTAERREQMQYARHFLKDRDISWLINNLLDNGPRIDQFLIREALAEYGPESINAVAEKVMEILCVLQALWRVRKLWRRPVGKQGKVVYFLYGIRGVHPIYPAPCVMPLTSNDKRKAS